MELLQDVPPTVEVGFPRLGLGTVAIGGLYRDVSEVEAGQLVTAAYEHGIRYFDTAPVYGMGTAERRLGRVLKQCGPRDSYLLSTKVGRLLRPDAAPDPSLSYRGGPMFRSAPLLNPVFDFTRDGVLRSLEESLERLGLDRVDIVYVHDPDEHYDQALREALPALESLRDQGVIRAIGVGMTQWEMLVRFAREAAPDCVLIAGRYTLLDRSAGRELLPLCDARGIRVIIGGVFNSGVLANPHNEETANYDYQPAGTDVLKRARRMEEVCSAHGVSLQAAAMQFPLRHPATAGILIGPRTVNELKENLRAFAEPVDDGLLTELLAVAE